MCSSTSVRVPLQFPLPPFPFSLLQSTYFDGIAFNTILLLFPKCQLTIYTASQHDKFYSCYLSLQIFFLGNKTLTYLSSSDLSMRSNLTLHTFLGYSLKWTLLKQKAAAVFVKSKLALIINLGAQPSVNIDF